MTKSDKWDKRERWRSVSIPLGSKGGIALMLLAWFGVMHIINLISYGIGNWIRWL